MLPGAVLAAAEFAETVRAETALRAAAGSRRP